MYCVIKFVLLRNDIQRNIDFYKKFANKTCELRK